MQKVKNICYFLFVIIQISCYAQVKKLNYFPTIFKIQERSFLQTEVKTNTIFTPSLKDNLIVPVNFNLQSQTFIPIFERSVHYTAFFCKMENKLHNKFNVWIKLRAGSDDEYQRLTRDDQLPGDK